MGTCHSSHGPTIPKTRPPKPNGNALDSLLYARYEVRSIIRPIYKKDEFGVPEAFWVIRVEDLPTVVTMDTHGHTIHGEVEAASKQALDRLLAEV